ncbi:carboxy terminal-processing peptidase [Alloalcanivorax mobilis]|uniref:carboxy terminal-processing peptidase n=1 Tax=Alloalcanivorax mobilis TaxID=2019569 RepID=UPI000B5B3F62|nr:carboxy terminal-processing peptidase [Alloalcanivorax mobilis]ASK33913.1 tail-specific protease [Alcanivorax sp. N3-2A]|tara:strand:+ start:27363 stop:29471 length:2109 start_codon:yes stop_codon:yes gene_type:complete
MSVFRKLFGVLLAIVLLCGALQVGGSLRPAPEVEGALKPTEVQREATEEIVDRLDLHYLRLKFNDALSERIFAQYLKDLDPNRLFLSQQDIQAFQVYRDKLDDQLGEGVLEGGYTIFNRYQSHLETRLTAIVAELNAGFDDWRFDDDTPVELDRTKADWASDQDALGRIWDRQLKNAVLSMRLNGTDEKEIQKRLVSRYQSQLDRVRQNTSEDVFQLYMNAVTQSFDPHTTYFTPHNSENFDISMSRSLEGIGAVLQYEDGYTKVVRLVPGGPAAKSGQLKPADRIVGVGQEDKDMVNIIGMRLDEVVDKIRGPKGSKVRLEVIPAGGAGEHDTHTLSITRNKVVLEEQAAKKAVIDITRDGKPMKLGVIEIPAFYLDFNAFHRGDPDYTSTTRDVAQLLMELRKENVDALAIDLRNNGGGSLLEVNKLVSLFINRGPTVQVREAGGRVSVESDQYPGILYAGPMAVLVNRYSASASEIFAGAMQDYGRALIVGDQTYGKGTVQTLLDLNHGKLKMTNAKFYRVSGSSNQNLGIVPDVTMPSLINKDEVGESTQPNAMPWDEIDPAKYTPVHDLVPLLPDLRKRHEARIKSDPEFVYVEKLRGLLDQARERRVVTLDEKKRRAWQQQFDQQRLAIENAVRKARGEEPIKKMADLRTLEEQRALDPESAEEPMSKDPYLKEAGEILADLVSLMSHQRVADKGA